MKLRGLFYGGAFLLALVLFAFGFTRGSGFLLAVAAILELLVAVLHGKQKNT